MSIIDLHRQLEAGDIPKRNLAEDRGLSEVRFGDLTGNAPFRAGLEYTPPARGTWTISHTPMLVPGSLEIFVCPEGCLRGVVLSATEFGGMDRFAMITVKENNLYDDSMEDLFIEGVTDILEHREELPTVLFLFSSCIHHMLATDTKNIFRVLRERFPTVRFVESDMNCTMRKSKLHFEEAMNRQVYAAIDPKPLDGHTVNLIGNYFPLDPDCELLQMLHEVGYRVNDINRIRTFDEYLDFGAGAIDLYNHPMARVAAGTLAERCGALSLYAPYCWDYDSIDQCFHAVSNATGAPLPNLEEGKERAEQALTDLYDAIGDTELQIDASATPRPLELAKLLISHGFYVTAVYADALSPEEEDAKHWLTENAPDVKLRAIVNFRSRVNPRNEARLQDGRLIAIGQKAAYFTGTTHFVNLIYNSGLHGYEGIVKLCGQIRQAAEAESPVKEIIQIKAWGCEA
ncbi:MAG: nitrogenase [Clostridia bacterium]|nr:nitrogenase [Clostridia bacterium]